MAVKLRFALTVSFGLLAASIAADEAKYSFVLSKGAGLPVCEALLKAALEAPPEVVGRCELPDSSLPDQAPGVFIDWRVLRNDLGPEFRVPEWHELDLTKQEDLENALFVKAVGYAAIADDTRSDGLKPWSEVYSNVEIRRLLKTYIAEGGLPRKILVRPTELEIESTDVFQEAIFDYGGPDDLIFKSESYSTIFPPICFNPTAQAYRNITLNLSPTPIPNQARDFQRDDIVIFQDKLYGVRYRHQVSSSNPGSILLAPFAYGEWLHQGADFDESICQLKLHIGG